MAKTKPYAHHQNNVLHSFKYLFVILLISGLNYRVFKFNRTKKIVFIFYCVCLTSVNISTTIVCCSKSFMIQTWAMIEYTLSVIILLVYNSKLTEFSRNLQKLDYSLRIKPSNVTNRNIFAIVIILWFSRIAFTVIYCICYVCYSNVTLYIISLISPFVLDVNRVWRFVLVNMVWYRLHILRMRLQEMPGYNFYLHISENKMLKDDKIRFFLNVYRRIVDTIDLITPELHASIFASIICSVPKLIANVYHILLVVEGQEPVESMGFLLMHIIQVLFFLCSPCFVIEMQHAELEKLRLSLVHMYIDTTDLKMKEDLQVFLQYTGMRGMSSKIWRFIPVNISLPIEVANLCGSCVIVLLNFTHLFG